MLFRSSLLLVFVTSAMAAVSSQNEGPAISSIERYRKALNNPEEKGSCESFKTLMSSQTFPLQDLAKLRHAEYCQKKTNWADLKKSNKMPILNEFILASEFQWSFDHKKYQEAWKIYSKHKKKLKIEDRDFDTMAIAALKTSLNKKEKANLRKELYQRSPRFTPNPSKKQYLKIARDYRSNREFEKALRYYRKVINDPNMPVQERWYGYKGARQTYKLERWARMKKYIKASKQWADFLRTHKKYRKSKEMTRLHHDANIDYIRTLWTEKGQSQAMPVVNRLEEEIKGRYSLQMVFWLKGRMAEERQKFNEAVKYLDRAAKEKKITDRDLERVQWALAWNQRRIKDFDGSNATLEKLKKSPELTFFSKTKYLYWQSENLESKGNVKQALDSFRRLAELDLYGYYGALAFRKLGEAFPSPPKPEIDRNSLFSFFNDTDARVMKALIATEERDVAESFIKENIKTDRNWNTEKWVAYLNLLQEAGAYKYFFYRYHTLPPAKQLAILEEHPYLLFPQPYKKEVEKSAEKNQISPALIYSIMKQESGFDAKARSHADAFGLLQLIPQVAKKTAARMPSIKYEKPYDLFKPDVIIPLGANNLHYLFSKFDSSFILSVASYNASEKAVRGWVKSRFNGDPITFIEDIPYEETKGYVKLVMRNYITYNRFDSKEDKFIFPEICLQGLQGFKR